MLFYFLFIKNLYKSAFVYKLHKKKTAAIATVFSQPFLHNSRLGLFHCHNRDQNKRRRAFSDNTFISDAVLLAET